MSLIFAGLRRIEGLFFKNEDARLYAAIRIIFAVTALINLLTLWPLATILFSDEGILDPDVARGHGNPIYLSVFEFAHSPAAVHVVFAVTALALVLLACGIWARLAAVWVFVWHLSFTSRILLATTGWDQLQRSFSFLILLSPLGVEWQQKFLKNQSGGTYNAPQYGLLLMRLQLTVVYWQTVLERVFIADPYWNKGEFLSYFLLSSHSRVSAAWVLRSESLLQMATYSVQLVEVLIPVLLWMRRTRWWGILLGVALHGGICLGAKSLEMFLMTMVMGYAAFLDRGDMDALENFLRRKSPNPPQESHAP